MRVFLAFVVASMAAFASPARACFCVGANLAWPLEDAHGVPPKAPLVISLFGDSSGYWQVQTEAGETVPVAVARSERIQGVDQSRCEATLLFAQPYEPLAEDTTYRVRFGTSGVDEHVRTFRTGHATETPDTPVAEATLAYDRLWDTEPCRPSGCNDVLELRELSPAGGPPGVLLLRSGEGDVPTAAFFGAAHLWQDRPGLSRFVSRDETCVEVEQLSITGSTVFKRALCTPHRCARLGADSHPGGYACGAPGLGDDFWDALPPDSCASIPTVHVRDDGAIDVEGFGDADDRAVHAPPEPTVVDSAAVTRGCSLSPAAARDPVSLLVLGLIQLILLRRRPRH